MIRWLANRTAAVKAEAGITARTDKAHYEPDSSITILAAVRNKEGEGTEQAEVLAQVKTPQGTTDTVTLAPVAGSAGSYQGSFESKRPGTYQIMVESRLGETVLRAEQTTAEVGRPNLEFDRLDLDDALLSRIAEATAGVDNLHVTPGSGSLFGSCEERNPKASLTAGSPGSPCGNGRSGGQPAARYSTVPPPIGMKLVPLCRRPW